MQHAARTLVIALLLLVADSAQAQQVTVQQPVFRSFSASTTVSVPDRGAAYLAGVGRAADSRSSFGPFRAGTNIGTAREHAGMNVGVWIHDFEEMDRRLLEGGAPGRGVRSQAHLSGPAADAWHRLNARHERRTDEPVQVIRESGGGSVRLPSPSFRPVPLLAASSANPSDKADRYYRLGLEAESRGAAGVARAHYLAAARNGSAGARERLERWKASTVAER